MANPIVPKNKTTPTGTARINGQSNAKLKKAHRNIGQRVKAAFNEIPREQVSVDQAGIATNATNYRYQINILTLTQLSNEIEQIINQEFENDLLLEPFVTSSFNLGTATALANLQAQVPDYPVSLEVLQLSEPHQVRVSVVQSRAFEEMQNLNSDMKTNLNRILKDGMIQGDSPRVIARRINQEIGIPEWNSGDNKASYARALRISRTEINHAHRVATRAQDQDANKLGIETGMLWFSALSKTTRRTHARRHGHDYTRQEVEDFYSRDGNEINCKCSQNSIVLKDGKPLDPEFTERLQQQGKTFFKD
jgi:hypothetical protein